MRKDVREGVKVNNMLGQYYGLTDRIEKYETYQENIRKYLTFNPASKNYLEIYTEQQPIQLYYILVDYQYMHIKNLEAQIERITRLDKKQDKVFWEGYSHIYDLEIEYHKANYQEVVKKYHPDIYHRPLAQHPMDRILMAIRASVYPLSLFYLGRKAEAQTAFIKIEETINDIKNSIFTKEFYMIKQVIFE